MGVKSTVRLTREEAIQKYAELEAEMVKRRMASALTILPDEALAELLERKNDQASENGEGFENYTIGEN